jgi:hypothetical protein
MIQKGVFCRFGESGLQTHPLKFSFTRPPMNSPNMLACAACGAGDFAAPEKATNASMVTCKSCGASLASVGQLQAAAKAALAAGAGKVVKEKFREAFRHLTSIKVE